MTLPDRYDFNEHFGVLPVYDQGATDDCFYFTRATVAAAKMKIHGQPDLTWTGTPGGAWVQKEPGNYTWEVRVSGQTHQVDESDVPTNDNDHQAVKQALLESGVLMVAIEVPESTKLFDQASMPIIVIKAADQHVSAHSLLAVGYTPDGIIVQSSWGLRWGHKGRAILGWLWWDSFVINAIQPQVDQWPIKDVPDPLPPKIQPAPAPAPAPAPTPAPAPAPAPKGSGVTLIKRTGSNNVYAITGGIRSWIYSREILAVQGVSLADVKELAPTHAVWKTPLVGKTPANGDV